MPRAFSSGARSIASYALNSPPKRSAPTFVSAAVSVVLPWSTWPIVPTFTWGLVRSNLPFAMTNLADVVCGAHEWNRTIDLLLTKEVLYRLSYVSVEPGCVFPVTDRVERNGAGDGNRTRTLSLEGCGSTIELLPRRAPLKLLDCRCGTGGGRWIRTTEGVSQQIYSLPPLAAWVSLRSFELHSGETARDFDL